MSNIPTETSVSPAGLAKDPGDFVILDVRKPMARAASGLAIAGALWRHPFDAANWAGEFKGRRVIVYCVHGHEVSRAVRGFLVDSEIDAAILEGGFEAWRLAGLPVETVVDADA